MLSFNLKADLFELAPLHLGAQGGTVHDQPGAEGQQEGRDRRRGGGALMTHTHSARSSDRAFIDDSLDSLTHSRERGARGEDGGAGREREVAPRRTVDEKKGKKTAEEPFSSLPFGSFF